MMATADVLFLFCFLISSWFLSTILCKSIKNYMHFGTKMRPPPSPPALPIIGHLHLIGSVLSKSFHNLAHKHGPIIQLHLGASTCYVVSDAMIAKEILKTNELNFICRPEFDCSDNNIYRGSGFVTAPYNTYWRFMKKLCMTRLLATSQLNQLVHAREEEIMKLVESLINISREGKSCNLKQEFVTMTNNVICRMAMSTRCVEDDANEAKEVKELVNQIVVLGGKLSAGNILGPLAKLDLFGHGRQLRNALEKFDISVEKIIKEHEDQREMKDMEGSGWRDLMDFLLAISGDSNAEMNLTRKDIKAFFLDIIMAGIDTSALTIQWIMAELINHQKIFNRLREEIDLAVGTKRLVKESDILNLPYLPAVVKETLRLHPPSLIILRQCAEDCKINGFDLKGKTRMLINLYSIQRDPNSWTDPEEFNPDRFMVDSNINHLQNQMEVKGQMFNYLPFGSGRRGCPASSLVLVVVEAAIGALVQCFDWEVIGEGKINLQEDSGFSMGMASPLVCYPITRFNPLSLIRDERDIDCLSII